jgi:NAD(P)-dependent dehydrogenase (short-subunit alcohol dehydrogenase family)
VEDSFVPDGINVNSICLGIADPALPRGHRSDGDLYARAKQIPLGRIVQTEDISRVVTLLASGAFSYITGQALLVNGGFLMLRRQGAGEDKCGEENEFDFDPCLRA